VSTATTDPGHRPQTAAETTERQPRPHAASVHRALHGEIRLGRRPALDGIRGGAVVLVMLNHTGALRWGFVGVDVFFALSGFLITTLLFEERQRHGRISLRAFYQRRARRLIPGLVLLLAAYTVAVTRFSLFESSWPLWQRQVSTFFYANNWVLATGHSPLGPLTLTWSLAQEEQFYLLWPILLCLLWRLRARPIVILALLVGAVTGLMYYLPHVPVVAHLDNYYNPLYRFGQLLIGCAAALLWRYRPIHLALRWSPIGLAAIFGIGYFADDTSRALLPRLAADAICAAVLVLHAATGTRSILARSLSLPPLRFIGTISYGLYLYHLAILTAILVYWPNLTWPLQTVILFPVSIVIAWASWHFVERRFLVSTGGHSVARTL
jgi:peptidoglycan/LPS O-acetylase OafA/YrhL